MTIRPLLLGHRGARAVKSIPENTLSSFDLCLAHGCDGFEFDVRLSGDGEAVVCHDAKVEGAEVAKTSAKKLSLPTLSEVLERYSKAAFLNIELKVAGLERLVIALLRQFVPHRGFVVSSFLPDALTAFREDAPDIPLGLICETRAQLQAWKPMLAGSVMLKESLASQATIGQIQTAGSSVYVWTVNREVSVRRFWDLGVTGIISDETALLGGFLAEENFRLQKKK